MEREDDGALLAHLAPVSLPTTSSLSVGSTSKGQSVLTRTVDPSPERRTSRHSRELEVATEGGRSTFGSSIDPGAGKTEQETFPIA